jgi:hypothetical protein
MRKVFAQGMDTRKGAAEAAFGYDAMRRRSNRPIRRSSLGGRLGCGFEARARGLLGAVTAAGRVE